MASTTKFLPRDSNQLVDMVMWPKLDNSSISLRQVIITLNFVRIWPEKTYFWGVILVQVQLFGAGTSYGLKILHQFGKRIKTGSQKVFRATLTLIDVTEEKLEEGTFLSSFIVSSIGLRYTKSIIDSFKIESF